MNKPVRHVRAGQLPPTEFHTDIGNHAHPMHLHRIDVDQMQPGGIYFSEPPPHVSTDETRAVRAEFWRGVVFPIAIIMIAVVCYLFTVTFS